MSKSVDKQAAQDAVDIYRKDLEDLTKPFFEALREKGYFFVCRVRHSVAPVEASATYGGSMEKLGMIAMLNLETKAKAFDNLVSD